MGREHKKPKTKDAWEKPICRRGRRRIQKVTEYKKRVR